MFSKERLPFSVAYLASLGLTLYFSLGVGTSRPIGVHGLIDPITTECLVFWGYPLCSHPNSLPCLLRRGLLPGWHPDPQIWRTNGDAWSRKPPAHLIAF